MREIYFPRNGNARNSTDRSFTELDVGTLIALGTCSREELDGEVDGNLIAVGTLIAVGILLARGTRRNSNRG